MCIQLAVFEGRESFAFHPTSAVRKSWMFKPEFGHFLFSPYRKGFWSLKYSPLTGGCCELTVFRAENQRVQYSPPKTVSALHVTACYVLKAKPHNALCDKMCNV